MHINALLVATVLLGPGADTKFATDAGPDQSLSTEQLAIAKEARAGVEAFLKAWNTGSNTELKKALHYPFITLRESGEVHIADKPEEFEVPFDRMRQNQRWDHSTFDSIEPVWVGSAKAHFKVEWSRHNTDGKRYVTGQILYVLNKVDGAWKTQVRSSMGFERLE